MPADLLSETRISFAALARREKLNPCTIFRWAKRGVRGVLIESFHVGGRRYTTLEAFARFCTATSSAAQGDSAAPSGRTNRQRDASIARAESELNAAGV